MSRPLEASARRRLVALLVLAFALGLVHVVVPAGPHEWHWLHLVLRKLHYVPIVAAAFVAGWRGAVATTAMLSGLFALHAIVNWRDQPMIQAEQAGELASLWVVAGLAALLAGRIRSSFEELRAVHDDTLRTLASCLELREKATAGHSERVRDYTLELARAMDIDGARFESLGRGALLHDIGKIGTPDAILLKEGGLTAEEWEVMRRHPREGARLLGALRFLQGAREMVEAHHERWDGSGYPRGQGEEIPIGARLFAVADVFDALTTSRPYHEAESFRAAAEYLRRESGRLFDPAVVEAFGRIPPERWEDLARRHGVAFRGHVE